MCLFCKIARGDIPAATVLETDEVVVFLDIRPVNRGHVLLVPKAHHSDLTELPEALAARHRLPAVYSTRTFFAHGGLIAYGPDILDQFRRSAAYVDRILKGEKPADLPVQAPTKFELMINLKTAKALGLEMPTPLVAGADEVIE